MFKNTLELLKRHRPFSNEVDLLPKIGQQMGDHYDICSPRSFDSDAAEEHELKDGFDD